ncbi:TPA: fumarate hydratase [Candidatus Sumerlaeota bacterium]|jgi:fumarate hydratase subunit alpha|nr:fumarate hydratase [Candidatus Sumerlaeota bacterium]
MRELSVATIATHLEILINQASFNLGERELCALREAQARESSASGRAILSELLQNADIARLEGRPLCQDTGVALVFLDIGQDVHIVGGDLQPAIYRAVRNAYQDNYLRKSMVEHPLARKNTGDNNPPIIHIRIVPGEQVRMRFAAKGGGCENMSRIGMLTPSAGREGVMDFIVRTVCEAGGNPCPPVVVGVGLGGNFEKSAMLAKEALMRPLGDHAEREDDAEMERELLARINAEGHGPMGLGGTTTALAVHVISHPCHIASLPVAVNIDCHSHRHAEVIL